MVATMSANQSPSRKPQTSQRVSGEGAKQQIEANGQDRDDNAVDEILTEGILLPDGDEVVERRRGRNKLRREGKNIFFGGFKGGAD